MEVTRIFDLLPHYKEIKPDQKVALAIKRNGEWIKYSIDEYIENVNLVSSGLLSIGVKKGDKIAIISSNRPEFNILDMGIMQIGAIPVPIYPTISEGDYNYILNHSETTYVFSEGEELLRKIENILPEVKTLKGIYTFANRGRHKYLAQLLEEGKNNLDLKKIEKIKASIKPEDMACMIYTSGTTGMSKGVMLSHSNIVNQVMCIRNIPSNWCDTAFSFLPMCHAYEKTLLYLYQYLGISIYYAESLGKLAENIKEVNPTIMTCVPRVLEKFYDKLYTAGKKLDFPQRKLYYWAMNLACKYKLEGRSFLYETQWRIADRLIYRKWREAIGGHFDVVVSGSSALQPRLAAFFTAIGMPIFEGYGLTETSPVIAVCNRKEHGRGIGTVGMPLDGVEVKIDPTNHEILCRGHNVMIGYFKAPELTAQAIDKDNWFHTGDTGKFDEYNRLIITGRIKSIFKTSMGKYINPFLIEEKFLQSPFIDCMMVVGENQKFAAALIVPNFEFLKSWCKKHDVEYTTKAETLQHPTVKARFVKEVNKYNAFFGETEKIRRFELIPEEWTPADGILTPTLKVKRSVAIEKYRDIIDKMFV